jgi:hypothetical protein
VNQGGNGGFLGFRITKTPIEIQGGNSEFRTPGIFRISIGVSGFGISKNPPFPPCTNKSLDLAQIFTADTEQKVL